MSKYSIKDIAAMAGVSIATVSRVINNKGKYSEETKEKVLKIINQTGYKVDGSAQSLKTNITFTIGILVPDIKNFFFADLVQKIEEELFDKNYSTIICNTDSDEEKEKSYLRMLENKKVDGIIVISGAKQGFRFESSLKNIPYICIDRKPADFNKTIFISSNHELGAQDAANYLLDHDVQRPAMVIRKHSPILNGRINGFRNSLEEHNIVFDRKENIFCFNGISSLTKYLSTYPETDGFFAIDDRLAIELIMALKQIGKKVPDDIQVIGFDNIPADEIISPTLTTIAQNTDKIAHYTIENILKVIKTPNESGDQILIPTTLVKRNSTF